MVGDGEALAEIAFPAEAEREAASYRLPPMVIDAAIQAVAGLFPQREEDGRGPRVPVAMDAIEVSARLNLRCFAYVRASGSDRFYVAVIGPDGEILARVRRCSFRAPPGRSAGGRPHRGARPGRRGSAASAEAARGDAAAIPAAQELRERAIDYLRQVSPGPRA